MISARDDIERIVGPLIDGEVLASESEGTIDVVNPSTGRRLLEIPSGGKTDADRAVASARRAYDDGRWSESPPSVRKAALHRLADFIAAHCGALDALDAGEMGKPVGEPFANAKAAAGLLRFYAESVDKLTGDVYRSDRHSFVSQTWVPRGVVAAVTPWNFPTMNAVRKIAPALAAGNCVVLKPSELASRSAVKLAQLATHAGLPPGVLNVVPGLGSTVGKALGLHPDVDMLTFTGSTAIGKLMLEYASQSNMKPVIAECGGKSPQIVFDDGVNLDEVSESIAKFIVTNQGQICSVGSRVLVQKSVEKALTQKLAQRFSRVSIGNAEDPKTTFGPIVSAKQCTAVMRYIDSGHAEGARLISGGRRVLESSGGYFVEPTLFAGVSPSATIAQEEIFGPVLSVIPFEDQEDAIRIANGTIYGLMAYVWTASLSTGMRMAKALRSSVRISARMPSGEGAGHAYSFEPARQSGVGTETGLAGMASYMRRQLIWIDHA